ncbi:MAG: NapC/NirT family cytochrome c, partial [Candidatus Kryptonium sp.]
MKKNKIFLKFGIGIVAVLFVLAFSVEFTSRPSFCPTCHYMEPFYESWKASSHRDVTCVKCHFPPGFAG